MDVETAMSDAELELPQREKIFSGKPIVLKRTSNKAAALSLGQQLKAFGADIRIKIEQDDVSKALKAAKKLSKRYRNHSALRRAVHPDAHSGESGKIREASASLRKKGLSLPSGASESPVVDLSHLMCFG